MQFLFSAKKKSILLAPPGREGAEAGRTPCLSWGAGPAPSPSLGPPILGRQEGEEQIDCVVWGVLPFPAQEQFAFIKKATRRVFAGLASQLPVLQGKFSLIIFL